MPALQQALLVSGHYMTLQNIKNILTSNFYEPTKFVDAYKNKDYPDKLEIKNSLGWNLALLIGMIILGLFLLTNIPKTENRTLTIIFCLFIIIVPIYYLLDRRPILTISSKGILFKNGLFKEWTDIKETFIENNDSYTLIITFPDSKRKVIGMRDKTYSLDEISHIIEHYKSKNGR